jgi:sulfate transport system ATP-binding protein
VALARALAPQPSVLLLDEPLGALDLKIRAQLRRRLRDIQHELGVTTILVTHDQDEAFELADRIGVIDHGELLEVGEPSDLYRRPRHPFTATFLGTANLLAGRRNGTAVCIGDLKLPAPPNTEHLKGQPVAVLSRPEEITLTRQPDQIDGQIIGQGCIERLEFAGPLERITLRLTGDDSVIQALLDAPTVAQLDLRLGDVLWVGIRRFHLLPITPS